MKLKINISPCPNDTFMFDALINKRIDTRGLEFELKFADIEQLNNYLLIETQMIHVSKMSYALLPRVLDNYRLLDCGSAIGSANGPVLVARKGVTLEQLENGSVAIPGEFTTANMLMSRLLPQIKNKPHYLFSTIADAVAAGEVQAGVLIHEGRFVYQLHGLQLLADLGELWSRTTSELLPLGALVISRTLNEGIQETVEELIRESILYAMQNPLASRSFVNMHAKEMDEQIIDKHIRMFVNQYSISLGKDGREAVCKLLNLEAV